MISEIKNHFEKALIEYTSGEHYSALLEAKEEYFQITGKLLEEDDDYEARMYGFNDWYLLNFVSRKAICTPIKSYILKNNLPHEIAAPLLTIEHSLYEYLGEDSHKRIMIFDLVANKKFIVSDSHLIPTFIKGDIFVGRVMALEKSIYLLDGQTVLPKDVKALLKKEAKKVALLDDPHKKEAFLFNLESLKTRWKRYAHIDASKIFTFK